MEDQFLNKIKQEFPKLNISHHKIIDKGWDYILININNKYLFRFPRDKKYPKEHILIEMLLLKELNKISNIKLPNYEFISKNKDFGGYKIINGKEFNLRIFKNLNNKKRVEIAKQLANFLSILHNFPLNKAKELGFKKPDWHWNIKKGVKEFMKRKETIFSAHLSEKEKWFIENYYKELLSLSILKKTVLLHGDISSDHILFNKNKIVGIIDFGDSNLGDPAVDFAYFWFLDKDFVSLVYKYYSGPKDKKFILRSECYSYQSIMNRLYHGVKEKNKELLNGAFKDLRKSMKEGFHTK